MLVLSALVHGFTPEPEIDYDEWDRQDAEYQAQPEGVSEEEMKRAEYDAFGRALEQVKMDCRNFSRFYGRQLTDSGFDPHASDADNSRALEDLSWARAAGAVNELPPTHICRW